jgi:hypothetical protein
MPKLVRFAHPPEAENNGMLEYSIIPYGSSRKWPKKYRDTPAAAG